MVNISGRAIVRGGFLVLIAVLLLVFGTSRLASSSSAGLLTNGDFGDPSDCTSDIPGWNVMEKGHLGILLVGDAGEQLNTCSGNFSARLGVPVEQSLQPASSAAIYQDVWIPAHWEHPILVFRYHIVTHDISAWSNFRVQIREPRDDRVQVLENVLEDGCESVEDECEDGVAVADKDLGWRAYRYDLRSFRGEGVRVWFENRNKFDKALGIWTLLDDVQVFDAKLKTNLPLIVKNAGMAGSSSLEPGESVQGVPRPPTPTPVSGQ